MDPHGNHNDPQNQSRRVASLNFPSRNVPLSQPQPVPEQFGAYPKPAEREPATPRMLRSVSGTIRSKPDISSRSSDDQNAESPHYVTSNEPNHARDPSFQQWQQQQYHQQAYQQQQQQAYQQQQTPQGHSRTPSSSRQQATIPNTGPISSTMPPPTPAAINPQQPTRKTELLPPASLATPPSKDAHSGSSVASKSQHHGPQSPQQTPHTPPNPQTPQHRGHQRQSSHTHQDQTQQQQQPQQFHRKSIGDWDFIKTIGAGSMGKVKLAQHNATRELCAVKIIPRAAKVYQRAHSDEPPPATAQEAAQRHKEYEKELARDKRTIREGALGRLLFHPYICRLYEMVPMTNHYYMLFEHVEGGQMLDYIVAHGSLKEKNARKFARGIASALDYCHRNNVVHRDLKIENIMINEKGDIKIIDFGLSNLYSPKGLLKTYCGSLYFAAPELLCARPYIGPEVDIWSFGVVMYVLVCGKVPFDDSSVSVLHEKIKRGAVEYPSFLSKECVSLLSRMLVVDPTKRATLHEVSHHPWMNKGYEYKISSYVPKRQPLTLPLDPEIIKMIASFELGSIQHITEELTNILTSVEYQMSCENWSKITEQGREYASASNSHILPDPTGGFHPLISIYFLVDEMKKRKKAKEEAVRVQYQQAQVQAREKQRQEGEAQVKGMAQALVQIQVQAPALAQAQVIAFPLPKNQGHSRQSSHNQFRPQGLTQQPEINSIALAEAVDKSDALPSISYPEQAHTALGVSRTHSGENELLSVPAIPDQQPQSPRESSPLGDSLDPNAGKSGAGFNSLLRKLSSKKYKTGTDSRGTTSPSSPAQSSSHPPLPKVVLPQDSPVKLSPQSSYASSKKDPMVRRGVSMKVTAKEKSSSSRINLHPSANTSSTQQPQYTEAQKPLAKPSEKKSHNRSSSTSTGQAKAHGFIPVEYLPPLPNLNTNNNTIVSNTLKPVAVTTSGRKLHPTARAKSVGHVRKDSYQRNRAHTQHNNQHPPLPNSLAAQNSDEIVGGESISNNDGFFDDVTLDDVEYQEIQQLTEDQIIEQFNEAKPNSMPSIEHCKTLFLKGFFSVQTTSTKPLPVIRYNIINVLSKLGVKFQEVKGGFVCAHTPSLQQRIYSDENSNNSTIITSHYADSSDTRGGEELSGEQKELYGDVFKSTSSSLEQDKPLRIRTPEPHQGEATKTPSRQPSLHLNTQTLSPPSNSGIKSHRLSNSIGGGHRRKFSIGNSILGTYRKKNGSQVMMPPNTPAAAKVARSLYPDEEDFEHEDLSSGRQHYDDDSVDSLNGLNIGGGSDMLISSRIEHKAKHQHSPSTSSHTSKSKKSPLKFEIHIVKVPLVGLYGVQFKKLLGNTWNYKTLASQVLNELNL